MAGYRAGGTLTPGFRRTTGSGTRQGGNGNGHPQASGSGPGQAAAGNGNGHKASVENGNGHGQGTGNGNGNGAGGNGNGHGPGGGDVVRSVTAKEQLFEILHVAFKRWRLIAGLFAVVALSGLLAVVSRGPQYAAKGKVMITSDRADAVVQPTEEDSLTLLKLNEAVVNSETHIIQSNELLKRVVRGLALARAGGNVVNIANAADDREAISVRAMRIGNRLKVTPIRNSNVIEIRFGSGDPSEAAQVVNRIIDEYLAFHADVHSQPGLPDFYQEQSTLLMQDLRRAEDSLSDYSLREGIVSPTAEIEMAVNSLGTLENELRTRNAIIVGTEEKLRAVRDQLGTQPEVVKRVQQLEVNPTVKQLREHLIDREVDQVALLRKYTENDRHVRDNQTEINELSAKLSRATVDEPMSVTSETFAANPVYEQRLVDAARPRGQAAREPRPQDRHRGGPGARTPPGGDAQAARPAVRPPRPGSAAPPRRRRAVHTPAARSGARRRDEPAPTGQRRGGRASGAAARADRRHQGAADAGDHLRSRRQPGRGLRARVPEPHAALRARRGALPRPAGARHGR